MCKTLGGDLLSKNLGQNGAQYHALVLFYVAKCSVSKI